MKTVKSLRDCDCGGEVVVDVEAVSPRGKIDRRVSSADVDATKRERVFDFQKDTADSLPKLILSHQSHEQSLNLETKSVYNAVPCFPHRQCHDHIVGCDLCDECMKSNELTSVTSSCPFEDWSSKFVH